METIAAALAAQNAVVALESLGLGSVYIGVIRSDIEGMPKSWNCSPGLSSFRAMRLVTDRINGRQR
ncbi:hypothetical protein C7534_101489 [Pseudomonas sp. OV226]|nr:hypothetical protein C7534_101489 [Pseudomonas sp. OV226]